jgi:orotate phosphoribosyltransferase
MHPTRARKILETCGAFLTQSHFCLAPKKDASGRPYFLHASDYILKDAVYPDTSVLREIAMGLAEASPWADIDVVVGPEKGAILLASWTADAIHLWSERRVLGVYAEKIANGAFELQRGFDTLVKDRNVLIVEDVLTSGTTVRATIDAVRTAGGNVIHVAAIVNRDPDVVTSATLGAPLETLLQLRFPSWNPEAGDGCPLCRDRIPFHSSVARKNLTAWEQFRIDRAREIA